MLGFTPISMLPFGEFFQRTYIGVADVTVTFSIDDVGISQIHRLSMENPSVGINVPDTDITVTYNFNNNNVSVPVNVGDVRFTWDLQEDVAEIWTEQSLFPESDNNYVWTLVEAIADASVYREPETTLFVNAEAIQDRPLADVNNNGIVTYLDMVDMGNYIKGILLDQNKIDYIENYMLPYMAENQDLYKSYYNVSGSRRMETWSSISTQTQNWTNVA